MDWLTTESPVHEQGAKLILRPGTKHQPLVLFHKGHYYDLSFGIVPFHAFGGYKQEVLAIDSRLMATVLFF